MLNWSVPMGANAGTFGLRSNFERFRAEVLWTETSQPALRHSRAILEGIKISTASITLNFLYSEPKSSAFIFIISV